LLVGGNVAGRAEAGAAGALRGMSSTYVCVHEFVCSVWDTCSAEGVAAPMFDLEQFGLDTEGHHIPIQCSRPGHHMFHGHVRERTLRLPAEFAQCATKFSHEFTDFRVPHPSSLPRHHLIGSCCCCSSSSKCTKDRLEALHARVVARLMVLKILVCLKGPSEIAQQKDTPRRPCRPKIAQ